MILTNYQIAILKRITKSALRKVYKFDPELIKKSGMERSAAFRFGIYFYNVTKRIDWLSSLHVDMEYNKQGDDSKDTPSKPHGTQPDFLMHYRDNDDRNILIIEFKHWSSREDKESDIQKLKDFTCQKGEYKYGLGIFIEFGKEKPNCQYFLDNKPTDK